jgi:hypothetical protein
MADHGNASIPNATTPAATDLGGSAVERYVYTPYGEVTVNK